jgi:hypothetical protein
MDYYALVFGSLVAAGLSPHDVAFKQLFWMAIAVVVGCAVALAIFLRVDASKSHRASFRR